jgi:hypothetical protein
VQKAEHRLDGCGRPLEPRLSVPSRERPAPLCSRTWVLLLRHERAACAVRVAEVHVAELRAAVDDEVLSPAREVHAEHRGGVHGVKDEVPVRHSVHAVGGGAARKAELSRQPLPIDAECVASDGSAAERQDVQARSRLLQALGVALPRRCVREQPV